MRTILFLVFLFVIGCNIKLCGELKEAEQANDKIYEIGFNAGVQCRGLLSAASCEIVLEHSKETK